MQPANQCDLPIPLRRQTLTASSASANSAQHSHKISAADHGWPHFRDAMPIEHHSLITEFPDHRETIHSLEQGNAHFLKLMEKYEEVDKEIVRMEEGIETPEDAVLTQL